MLVRLRKSLTEPERERVLAAIRELGLAPRALESSGQLYELSGAARPELRSRLSDLTGVAAVLDTGEARELSQRAPGQPDTVVRIGGAAFGGGSVSLVAGPCAVEDGARLRQIAESVRASGATLLRGGAFKPRTSPHSFQGLGADGLAMLAEARVAAGLPVVTEVLDPRDVERVGSVADAFQVGSRSMSNAALLTELGRAGKPVLLKRGMAATAHEFLLAAEYLLVEGNSDVLLCERGIRGSDRVTRNVLDLGTVAWLKRHTHLPVVVDPSHAAGRADLVPPLARAALAAGADGLVVEVHPDPIEVHSDGPQALSLEEFARLAQDARALCELFGRRLHTSTPASAGSPE